jgi:hypothetical protein
VFGFTLPSPGLPATTATLIYFALCNQMAWVFAKFFPYLCCSHFCGIVSHFCGIEIFSVSLLLALLWYRFPNGHQ